MFAEHGPLGMPIWDALESHWRYEGREMILRDPERHVFKQSCRAPGLTSSPIKSRVKLANQASRL